MKYDDIIRNYESDVEFPDVSGFEHLDMLLTRTEIAAVEQNLTETQRKRVSHADRQLIAYARQFYESIQKIASLDQWRSQYHVAASHWWWYLDVIAYAATVFFYPSVHETERNLNVQT